jgi:hypothetical protein
MSATFLAIFSTLKKIKIYAISRPLHLYLRAGSPRLAYNNVHSIFILYCTISCSIKVKYSLLQFVSWEKRKEHLQVPWRTRSPYQLNSRIWKFKSSLEGLISTSISLILIECQVVEGVEYEIETYMIRQVWIETN